MATGRKNDYRKRPTNRPVKKINSTPKGNARRFSAEDRKRNTNKRNTNKRNNISFANRLKTKKSYSQVDFVFLFLVFLLLAFGFVILLSVSTDASRKLTGDSYDFVKTQMIPCMSFLCLYFGEDLKNFLRYSYFSHYLFS